MIIDEKEKELLKLILDTDNNKAIFERILERIKQVENDQA